MKKIVLALVCSMIAYSGNSSLKGSLLVNTVSFADLPEPAVSTKIAPKPSHQVKPANKVCVAPEKTTTVKSGICNAKVEYVFSNCSRKS
ncbi:hypothetical protein HUW51_21720 [Adhaeribacter swui]|uniref:Uncharacterized protein n=1 Tax=Adhaeribacter swui TaxID=2086471 RepID=A0A7G7GDH3_9BACT|nr:hypothetical protein [Adhaeribacter swui]QNF35207.1 hypothetical protein HUW51_21720 [Adhaeribacter swui]